MFTVENVATKTVNGLPFLFLFLTLISLPFSFSPLGIL